MKTAICTINHNTLDKRVTISFDHDDHKLYSDNEEILDTPAFAHFGEAVDFCKASWGVDPVGVWGLEWIEADAAERMVYVAKSARADGDEYDLGITYELDEARALCKADLAHLTDAERRHTSDRVDGWKLDVLDGESAADAYHRAFGDAAWIPDADFSEEVAN